MRQKKPSQRVHSKETRQDKTSELKTQDRSSARNSAGPATAGLKRQGVDADCNRLTRAATMNLALQGEQAVEEEDDAEGEEGEEEEECSVCLCVLVRSEGGECRLVCKHAYHASCLDL